MKDIPRDIQLLAIQLGIKLAREVDIEERDRYDEKDKSREENQSNHAYRIGYESIIHAEKIIEGMKDAMTKRDIQVSFLDTYLQ